MSEFVEANTICTTGEVYLTIPQVCQLLQCSEVTLWRKCKHHGLQKVKVGGLVRFRKTTLEAWLRDHERGSSEK